MMSSYKERLDLKGLDDEDDLSDNEVFTRGGKSIPLEENGVNKPLMAPRQRSKDTLQTKVRKVPSLRYIWAPIFYFLVTLSSIISVIGLVVFLINIFMKNASSSNHLNKAHNTLKLVPCTKITTQDVWVKTFPMLTTETAIRLNDINADGIEDIILGFGTGADAFYYPQVVCHVYFPKSKDGCGGGILALDGKTGNEIWRHYSAHEIFAINCNADLNGDGIKDCLGGGRMAGFSAISGKDGLLLWEFDDQNAKIDASNVYTPQYLGDIDFDSIPDILVIHGGDPLKEPGSETRLIGRLMIVSGKTGRVLRWVQVPDGKESYYSPQLLTHSDGANLVLFGTGGETHGGSLWFIKLKDLMTGEVNRAKKIYSDRFKGIMTPPVLIDVTGDGVLDIIMAMFNSSVIAFNGLDFSRIWEYHQPSSETYSTPGVGYFNNDSVPDFIITYQTGPGFPIYYFTQTTILDGRTGKPLLAQPIKMVVGTQTSSLVISVKGTGNDIFLYWVSDCHGSKNNSNLEYDFLKGTSVHEQSRADFCKLRFKEKLFTKMYALTSHMSSPGKVIYDSDLRKATEYSNPINYTALGLEFLYRHPSYQEDYRMYADENVDFENHVLQQDFADLPNQYDDIQLEKMLSRQPQSGRNYPDFASYSLPDYQNDGSFYMPQGNSGNEGYYPANYQSSAYRVKKPRTKKINLWPRQYLPVPNSRPRFFPRGPTNAQVKRKRRSVSKASVRYKQELTKPRRSYSGKYRIKRHVGPHDGGGIQRTISTGTLAPSLSKEGIDILYATFWFYPSDVQGLLPEDKECIKLRMEEEKERFDPTSIFYGMDHDAYEEVITEECLKRSGHLKVHKKTKLYNPFNRPMGQMTVYRTHLNCVCPEINKTFSSKCATILPFKEQMWTSYMGFYGNSVAMPRKDL
ncbi:uncharacterized protein LOC129222185 [Uloborus diversus]|uniref:uncharacterized protein LOC129222185 n=1 Tax=Uloborus diversus TaxID=327109 RepID=UPI00240A8205|nr:uncharacterized protein LOC129222185 [Uloborus diversus]